MDDFGLIKIAFVLFAIKASLLLGPICTTLNEWTYNHDENGNGLPFVKLSSFDVDGIDLGVSDFFLKHLLLSDIFVLYFALNSDIEPGNL